MVEDLKKLRFEVDLVDQEILVALERRFEVLKKIAVLKQKQNLQLRDIERENEILKRIEDLCPAHAKWLKQIYQSIFGEALSFIQHQKTLSK